MTFRGICEHGKVRAMISEPDENYGPEWREAFKKRLAGLKRRAHTVDYVDDEVARTGGLGCNECRKVQSCHCDSPLCDCVAFEPK